MRHCPNDRNCVPDKDVVLCFSLACLVHRALLTKTHLKSRLAEGGQ